MATEVLQGTLDLMVLRTLDVDGTAAWVWPGQTHPPGVERPPDPEPGHALSSAPPVGADGGRSRPRWGVSENNRKAKFYELTARGRRQIHEETKSWELTVALMARFLAKPAGDR